MAIGGGIIWIYIRFFFYRAELAKLSLTMSVFFLPVFLWLHEIFLKLILSVTLQKPLTCLRRRRRLIYYPRLSWSDTFIYLFIYLCLRQPPLWDSFFFFFLFSFHGSGNTMRRWSVWATKASNLWANERPHAVIWGCGSSATAAPLLGGERTHTGPPFHICCVL